jgi:two-component system, NarL family, sensor histidine kinase DesK
VGPAGGGVVLVYLLLPAGACVVLVPLGLDRALGPGARPVVLSVGVGVLTVAGIVVCLLAYRHPASGHPDGPTTALVIVTVVEYVAALAVSAPLAASLAAVAGGGLVKAAVSLLEGDPTLSAAGPALVFCLFLLAVVLVCRGRRWALGVAWQLDRTRQAEASLAVAEERLRFARDLHDVVGRNLSVVALKSELAAQLARRQRPGADDEMLAVRQLAEDTLAEIRAVVSGYRAADLNTELAGAGSLLASAGIRCEVTGDCSGLPSHVQHTLGWVVREATTNVLRHSEARTCTLSLARGVGRDHSGQITLIVENDGTRRPSGPCPSGSGLIGLAERLAGHEGTLTTEHRAPDRFRLTVTMPSPAADTR